MPRASSRFEPTPLPPSAPGHYSVEASTNLADWVELTNFTTTSSTFQYLDAETNRPQRFYRMRLTP